MAKNKEGVLLTNQDEIQKRWNEHFLEILNCPTPEDAGEFDEDDGIADLEIAVDAPTRAEIYAALKEMKNGTAGELIAWEQEQLPKDWRHGLIMKLPKKGDLTECGNWWGITLMAVAAKVLGRVIITCIRDGVNDKLHQEQGGSCRVSI